VERSKPTYLEGAVVMIVLGYFGNIF